MWENPATHYNDDEKWLDGFCSAWAKSALAWRTEMRFGHRSGSVLCMGFVEIHVLLEAQRRRFESGGTYSLLLAVKLCAEENVPLPTWLANAYSQALESFGKPGGPPSLDVVFRSPAIPTDTPQKLEKARRDWQVGGWLWRRACELAVDDESITSLDGLVTLILQGTPPDNAPFRQWPVKKTKARELILMIDKNQGELLDWPASKALSYLLERRRKQFT